MITHDFICPKCGSAFTRTEKTLACPQGHSYDIAKQGYVNLLPGGRLPGHIHGDNREMIRARRDFLSAGHYRPLADALSARFSELVPDGGCILDCGCGEGYYSACIADALSARNIDVLATDISKDAVSYAARHGNIRCAVANSFRLPIRTASCDAVLCICTPIAASEFSRILKPGGILLAVFPDVRHLWEMKCAVYETPYENVPSVNVSPKFIVSETQKIRFPVHIETPQQIKNLFSMTPYAYNSNASDLMRLDALEMLDDHAEFVIFVCRKQA